MDNNTVIIPYNSYQERIALACVVLVIAVCGAIGNIMVISAVFLSKTLQTKTNIFVVNLSIADLFACLFMPWSAVALISYEEWLLPGTERLCQISGMIVYFSIGCSLWNLTFIAINRLILITRPLRTYQRVYSPYVIVIMILLSWIVPVTLISIPTLVGFGKLGFERHTHMCVDIIDTPQADRYDIYQGIVTGLQVAVIATCYVLIYMYVTRHFQRTKTLHETPVSGEQHELSTYNISAMATEHISSASQSAAVGTQSTPNPHSIRSQSAPLKTRLVSQRDAKNRRDMVEITKNLFVVVCVLLVCLMPIIVANCIKSFPNILQVYAQIFSLVNSSLDPLIYAWRHPHFKIVLRLMIRCRYENIPHPTAFLRKFL